MTLIIDFDLDIELGTENEDCRSSRSKVRAWTGQTDRQTHRRDRVHYHAAFVGGNYWQHNFPCVRS